MSEANSTVSEDWLPILLLWALATRSLNDVKPTQALALSDTDTTSSSGHTVVVESCQAVLRDAQGQLSAIMEFNRDIIRRREIEQAARLAVCETVAHLSFLQQVLDTNFGRFVRAENAREIEIAGTGLGLYLSRELIELRGGQPWFESMEGAGTTFFLKIPLP